MHDLGEVLVNTVAALAATSLCHFGVTLKDTPQRARTETAVVQRVRPPARTGTVAALRARNTAPCPKDQRV